MAFERDGAARPLPDDQVSFGSYRSDAHTLPGDMIDDAHSSASVSSHDSFDSYCPRERLPSYRVPKEQGVSQPVYETWIFSCPPGTNDISLRAELYEQHELADMTFAAAKRYQAAKKRCLPSRLIRGRAKTYERDLDERILGLPQAIQAELHNLLADREDSTWNRFHRRHWTVVLMREQYRYRFASTEYEDVKKPRCFWKNKNSKRQSEYFFVLRGGEGKVGTDDKGLHVPRRYGNPWKRVDEIERVEKQRARDMRHHGKEHVQNGWSPRPRGRSVSPPASPWPDVVELPPGRVRDDSGNYRSRSRRSSPSSSRSSIRSPELLYPTGFDNRRHPFSNPFVPGPTPGRYGMPVPTLYDPLACGPSPPPPILHPVPPSFPRGRPYPYMPMSYPVCWPPPPPPPPACYPPPPPPPMAPPSPLLDFANPFAMPPPPPPPPMAFESRPRVPSFFSESFTRSLPPRPESLASMNSTPPPPDWFRARSNRTYSHRPPMSAQSTGDSDAPHSPPPAPRLSNLTTPTTFSPATSNRAGSNVDDSHVTAPTESETEIQESLAESPRPAGPMMTHKQVAS